jgi:hypothetical protein
MTIGLPDSSNDRSDVILKSFINKQNYSEIKGNSKKNQIILKNNKLCHQKKIADDFTGEETNEAESFITTNFKCDICLQDYQKEAKEFLKRCDRCFAYYHMSCAKDIGDKDAKSVCKKCESEKSGVLNSCIVCERTKGSMMKCNKNWIHVLCALFHKNMLYKKHDQTFSLGMENKNQKPIRTCMLCFKSNCYTTQCTKCDLIFHPYCGLVWNLDIILIEKKASCNDILNKYEVVITCENHKFFLPRRGPPQIEQVHIKHECKNTKRINFLPSISKKDSRKIRLISKEPEIISFNYQKLKSRKKNTFQIPKNFCSGFNWDSVEEYFEIINTDLLELKRDANFFYEKEYSTTFQRAKKDTDIISCKFKSKYRQFLCWYDISKVKEMKLDPDYMSYSNSLLQWKPKGFMLKNKRRRSKMDEIQAVQRVNQLMNRNVRIIDDEQIEEINNKNKDSQSTRKIKLSFDELDGSQTNNLPQENNGDSAETESNSLLDKKFIKKIKFVGFCKIKKKERKIFELEEKAYWKLMREEPKYDLLYDVDKEIAIQTEMLKKTYKTNISTLQKIKNHLESYTPLLEKEHIIKTFSSYRIFNSIANRLYYGIKDKTIEELLRSRNQLYKLHTHKYEANLENYYSNLIANESDCSVCFHSDSDDTSPIVFCDRCNVSVHQECYGIKVIPEGEYYCDLCASCDKNVICQLCLKPQGAMKKVDKNWVHMCCLLVSSQYRITNYSELETAKINEESLHSLNKHKCYICDKIKGDLHEVDCCKNQENKFAHFLCAYFEGHSLSIIKIKFEGEKFNSHLKLKIFCLHNSPENKKTKLIRTLTYLRDSYQKN